MHNTQLEAGGFDLAKLGIFSTQYRFNSKACVLVGKTSHSHSSVLEWREWCGPLPPEWRIGRREKVRGWFPLVMKAWSVRRVIADELHHWCTVHIKARRLLEGFKEQPSSHYATAFMWSVDETHRLTPVFPIFNGYTTINLACELHFRYSKAAFAVTSHNATAAPIAGYTGFASDSKVRQPPTMIRWNSL